MDKKQLFTLPGT